MMVNSERMWVVRLKEKRGGIVHGSIADTREHAVKLFLGEKLKSRKELLGPDGCYEAVTVWCSMTRPSRS